MDSDTGLEADIRWLRERIVELESQVETMRRAAQEMSPTFIEASKAPDDGAEIEARFLVGGRDVFSFLGRYDRWCLHVRNNGRCLPWGCVMSYRVIRPPPPPITTY